MDQETCLSGVCCVREKRRGKTTKLIFDCDPGHADIMAMMNVLAQPELFEEQKCRVRIELAGAYTQGMTVIEEVPEVSGRNVKKGTAAERKGAEMDSANT